MEFEVGKKVLVRGKWNSKYIRTIEKITPKGNVRLDDGKLYNPDGSQKTSDYWNQTTICILTEEMAQELEKEAFVKNTIEELKKVQDINYEDAVKIMKILKGDRQ